MRLIKVLLCILMLTACSNKNIYDKYADAYKASGEYQSYTNKTAASIIIDNADYQYDINNVLYYENGELSLYSVNLYNGDTYGDCKINVQDNKIYYDCAGSIKYYEDFDQDTANMNDLYFTKDEYDQAEEKDGKLYFTMSKDYCIKIIEQSIMQISDLKSYENKMIISIEDGKLISQQFELTFDADSYDANYQGSYKYTSNYENINNTTNERLNDTSLYVDINSIVNDKTLDEVKQILIDEQGYQINDQGLYVCDFNGNESYIFDFDNKQFTYVYGLNSYTYNWKSMIGTYDKCVYNYETQEEKGICSEDDLDKIEEARVNYFTELAFCKITEMPQE